MASNQKLKLHIAKKHQSKNDLIDISLDDIDQSNQTDIKLKQESKDNSLSDIQEISNNEHFDLTPDDFDILRENFL